MHELHHSKLKLRRHMRQLRRALTQNQRDRAAIELARHVTALPGWDNASKVALYLPSDGEADPSLIEKALRSSGKAPYLPVIQADNSLLFAPWEESGQLQKNRFGIPEPQTATSNADELEIILLPLVAWDAQGQRLGMGGGYYDSSLAAASNVIKVGVAFELQRVDALVTEPWDIRMDFIATESRLIECQGKDQEQPQS
ncbi:MAG: 5-formyltetrahydrofolate cyclo-ligase [Halioglobus sp.]